MLPRQVLQCQTAQVDVHLAHDQPRVARQDSNASSDVDIRNPVGSVEVILCDKTKIQLSDVGSLRAQNAEQQISQLPDELLRQIFMMGVLPPHAATYPALLRKFCDTKRYLGQVCYRWRAVALNCPDMWCNAVDLSTGIWWIEEVLKRSQGRPLTVFMPRGTKEENFALVAQTNRIQRFFANGQQPYLASQVLGHLRDLRGLEELQLVTCSCSRSRLKESLRGWSKDTSMPGCLSSLRSLYLTGPPIPLPAHLMLTLTSLYVGHSWGSRTSSEWLSSLSNFPNLEELSLINCIRRDNPLFPSSDVKDYGTYLSSHLTHLPRLRELELNGSYFSCGDVFQGLVIPPTCVLRMATYDTRVGPCLDAVVGFLKAGSSQYRKQSPFYNRLLSFKATSTQLYLQVSEEGVIRLDIHLKFDDSYYKELDTAVLTVKELLSATVLRFQSQGGFSSLIFSLAKLLTSNPRFNHWLHLVKIPLSLPQEIYALRLQEATTIHEFLKLTTDSYCVGKGMVLDKEAMDPTLLSYPRLQQVAFTHIDFDEQAGPAILQQIVSFILRHPKINLVRLIQCKHVGALQEKVSNLGVEVTVD